MNSRCLILYDGVCGLCDRTVQWLIKKDTRQAFSYAPLQGSTAKQVFERLNLHPVPDAAFNSIILIKNIGMPTEEIFFRSDAALQILRELGGGWRFLYWLKIIPGSIRDWFYNFIASRRYQWFGKFDTCRIPNPQEKERFLP